MGDKNTILLATISFSFLLLGATFTNGMRMVLLLSLTGFAFGLRNPVNDDLVNKQVISSKRATVISTDQLIRSLGMTIGAPFIGYLADLYTINTAFMITGISILIAAFLALFLKD